MNPSDLPRVALLILPAWAPVCSVSIPTASLTVPRAVSAPARLPKENMPEVPHPPHGEGSGELAIFTGISASGMMSNTASAMVSSSWEPPGQSHPPLDRFFVNPVPHGMLKFGSVTPQRPLPRARRSC
jgi:hypothetical protein